MITGLPWDLEERVEDAIVAQITEAMRGRGLVVAARSIITARYPLIVVQSGPSDNFSDDATFNGGRRMDVIVAITTETTDDDEGESAAVLLTARDRHRAVKSTVIESIASAELHTHLNNRGIPGVCFSHAHPTQQTRDQGDGKIITEQVIDVIASPIEEES